MIIELKVAWLLHKLFLLSFPFAFVAFDHGFHHVPYVP
jgi:hypothetical protein